MSSSQRDAANTVPDTQLGLTADEIALLRQHQQAAANGSSSSRAASRASSQGVLMIDSSSLAQLGRHFDRVMNHIQRQIDSLSEQAQVVTMQVYDHAGNLIDNADAEIARFNDIMGQLDELELDFDRIRHIRDIVRDFRRRAEELDREVEKSSSRRERDKDRDRDREGHHRSHGHGHSSHRSHGHGHSSSRSHRH